MVLTMYTPERSVFWDFHKTLFCGGRDRIPTTETYTQAWQPLTQTPPTPWNLRGSVRK
jgi:hypothetical protein